MNTSDNHTTKGEEYHLLEFFYKIWRYKWWYLLSVSFSILWIGFYLLRTPPTYRISSIIAVNEDKNRSLESFDLSLSSGIFSIPNLTENEVELLKSKNLLYNVCLHLKLYISIKEENFPYNKDLYENYPIDVILSKPELLKDTSLTLSYNDEYSCYITSSDGIIVPYKYGTIIPFCNGELIITTKQSLQNNKNLILNFHSLNKCVRHFTRNLSIRQIKKTNAVDLSINETSIKRGKDILYTLFHQHNFNVIKHEQQIGKQVNTFILERLKSISSQLNLIEDKAKKFKQKNIITHIPSESQLLIRKKEEILEKQMIFQAQKEILLFIQRSLQQSKPISYSLLPETVRNIHQGLESSINLFNDIILRKQSLMLSASEKSPVLLGLNNQLEKLNKNILNSIQNALHILDLQIQQITLQQNKTNSKIARSSKLEKESRSIERDQELTEQIYLFLLKKSEETKIAMTGVIGNIKMIDTPNSDSSPIKPQKMILILLGGLFGLLIPTSYLFLKDFFYPYVQSKTDLKRYPELEYVGTVSLDNNSNSKRNTHSFNFDARMRFEEFAFIRENLQYHGISANREIIMLTSSIPGEGKSFCCANLAYNYSKIGKKVLVIECDMRRPSLHYIFRDHPKQGLSAFLSQIITSEYDIIHPSPYSELIDVILAGNIPPNPISLLKSDRMMNLLASVRNRYDIILLDAPPNMVIADPLAIAKYVDAVLYIVGAGKFHKSQLRELESLRKENKFPNLTFIINRVSKNTLGYEYGYKYDY